MEKKLNLSFSSLSAFFAYLEKAKENPQQKSSERLMEAGTREERFNAFPNWQDAQAAARQGWPEGLKAVRDLSSAFVSKVGSGILKETFTPAETGLFFDVGLVLTGQPEAWLQTTETEEEAKGGKLVTIGLNCSVSSGISKEVIRMRGAALLALVQLLEASGRSVRVLCGIAVTGGIDDSFSLQSSVCLKAWGEALDEDKLAFWLVCEDAFRRFFFRLMEACPIWKGLGAETGCGYGKVSADWIPEGSDIGLGGMRGRSTDEWSEAKAKAWIEEQLKAQGVSLAEA